MIRSDQDPDGFRHRGAETGQWEGLVRRIMRAAGPELARRRRERTLLLQFEEWSRPVYSAAALLILIFGSVLVLASRAQVEGAADGPLIVEAVLPNPLSLWLEMGTQPTLVEMVNAFEEDSP